MNAKDWLIGVGLGQVNAMGWLSGSEMASMMPVDTFRKMMDGMHAFERSYGERPCAVDVRKHAQMARDVRVHREKAKAIQENLEDSPENVDELAELMASKDMTAECQTPFAQISRSMPTANAEGEWPRSKGHAPTDAVVADDLPMLRLGSVVVIGICRRHAPRKKIRARAEKMARINALMKGGARAVTAVKKERDQKAEQMEMMVGADCQALLVIAINQLS